MDGDKEILRRIGERMRKARASAGYSQEGLAHACELHRTYIGSIERGERNVSALNLVLISTILKIDPGSLIQELKRTPPKT